MCVCVCVCVCVCMCACVPARRRVYLCVFASFVLFLPTFVSLGGSIIVPVIMNR